MSITSKATSSFLTLVHCNHTVSVYLLYVEQLRSYKGPRYDLAPAEQFLLALSDFPEYHLLLEGLHFKAELSAALPRLSMLLRATVTATRNIMHHVGLRDFLKVVLDAGNFLNTVSLFF